MRQSRLSHTRLTPNRTQDTLHALIPEEETTVGSMGWAEYLLAVGLLASASCQTTFRLDSRFVTGWSEDRKLVNFSLSTHSVRNVHQCIALCSQGCRSVNFSPGNPGECQLNSQAVSQSSGFLVSHAGTIYASVASQVSSGPLSLPPWSSTCVCLLNGLRQAVCHTRSLFVSRLCWMECNSCIQCSHKV